MGNLVPKARVQEGYSCLWGQYQSTGVNPVPGAQGGYLRGSIYWRFYEVPFYLF